MKPRDVVIVSLIAIPIGVAVGWASAALWERIDRLDWPGGRT